MYSPYFSTISSNTVYMLLRWRMASSALMRLDSVVKPTMSGGVGGAGMGGGRECREGGRGKRVGGEGGGQDRRRAWREDVCGVCAAHFSLGLSGV